MFNDMPDSCALARVITGLTDYTILAAERADNELIMQVVLTRVEAPCPGCGVFASRVKSLRWSWVTDSPSHGARTRLRVLKRAFRCDSGWCERRSFTQTSGELPSRARVTTRCKAQIAKAGKDRCVASVATEFGVGWWTAWRAIAVHATVLLAARPPMATRTLGVDETRFWWREPWLTGFVDIDTGDLIDIAVGRSADTVRGWLASCTDDELAMITVVVTDPHAGYRKAITDTVDVVTVVDRFHIAMLANSAVTAVRRRRIWEQADRRGRKIDAGWRARRDLMRNSINLTDRGWLRLIAAFKTDTGTDDIDGDLAHTWAAKEYLAAIYNECRTLGHARQRLIAWYQWVVDHPVPELVTLATTISAWEPQFLAYFTTRATNGRTEGINRVIKHVKRLGYGYRNTDHYRLKILYRCHQLPSSTNQ
jgi:transposase